MHMSLTGPTQLARQLYMDSSNIIPMYMSVRTYALLIWGNSCKPFPGNKEWVEDPVGPS